MDDLRDRALNALDGDNEAVVLALLRIGDLLAPEAKEDDEDWDRHKRERPGCRLCKETDG